VTHERLAIGFELDRRWHHLRGEMEDSKEAALLELAAALDEAGTPYAIIGGIAVQVRRREPRTTLDIDVAVLGREQIPAELLQARGFQHTGSHPRTENWRGPGEVPVQFTDDPAFMEAIARAEPVPLGTRSLRVVTSEDLLHAKLRAAADPARRRSKRLQDLGDAVGLVEESPELEARLLPAERALLDRLPR
jgi:hypothetical protein